MGSPFDVLDDDPNAVGGLDFLFWLVALLLIFGLFFGSFVYNETKGGGGSNPAPTEDHHGPGGEEQPLPGF